MPTGSLNESQVRVESALLEKARRLGLELPLDLERLAIARGCLYYERDLGPRVVFLNETQFSNEELAVALITPSLAATAREIRLAATLLGGPNIQANLVAELAVQERCIGIVRYIAQCGQRYEPDNPFWKSLFANLPNVAVDLDQMPHPTRFVEMTGMDRGKVGTTTQWIRPRRQPVA